MAKRTQGVQQQAEMPREPSQDKPRPQAPSAGTAKPEGEAPQKGSTIITDWASI